MIDGEGMKKIIKFFMFLPIFISILIISSCDSKIIVPENFVIENDIILFQEVENYTYKGVFIGEKEYKRIVKNGTTLESLTLPYGEYTVYLEISDGKGTAKTESLTYKYIEKGINLISGEDMVNLEYIKWHGRTKYENEINMMYHSGSGFEVEINGTELYADIHATNAPDPSKRPYLAVVIDEDFDNPTIIPITSNNAMDVCLAKELKLGTHNIKVFKRSESLDSFYGLKSIRTDGAFLLPKNKERFIEIIGDSTTAGYGNETKKVNGQMQGKSSANSNVLKTFSVLSAIELNADFTLMSASGWGLTGSIWTNPQTVNIFDAYKKLYVKSNSQGQSYSQENYDYLSSRNPDVVIISVGTNDLYYIEAVTGADRQERIKAFKEKYLELVTFLNEIYTNTDIIMVYGAMGESRMYSNVEAAYQEIIKVHSNVHCLKLKGDMGAVDNHPTVKSNEEMAEVLINKIKEIKNW